MSRMRALILERDQRAALRELGRLGVVQLTRAIIGPDTAPLAAPDRRDGLARCDHLLTRVTALGQSLELTPPTERTSPRELSLTQVDEALRLMETEAGVLLRRRQTLLLQLNESVSVCNRVSSYCGLDLPLGQSDRFSFLHFVTGYLPAENLERVQHDLGENVALLSLREQADRIPLIAITTRRGRAGLDTLLGQAGFELDPLPALEGATVDSLAQSKQSERLKLTEDLAATDGELKCMSERLARPVAELENLIKRERQLLEAEQNFACTETSVLLSGWVPLEQVEVVADRLRHITGGACVSEMVSAGSDRTQDAPVLLRHSRWLRPFEMLVSAYGLPSYSELEPTLFVAFSYILMFGMMFGDLGHGAVLALVGLALWFKCRAVQWRRAGVILLAAAISSMVFGIAYGSCFGLESFKKYALWHDPLEGDPMALMLVAMALGVVMISLGLTLNIINRFRAGDLLGACLDKFGLIGLVFYWGTLALCIGFASLQARGMLNLAIAVFVVVPLVGWSVKEPLEYFLRRRAGRPVETGDGCFAAVVESFVGAFEAVLSYLANTISFVRLAAYALSHAALLVAAFMLAKQVHDLPGVGGALSLVVIILGNVVAILLEGIIASVQALRLEYYEFLGKFFSGGGQPFTPFRLEADGPEAIRVA